LEAPWHAPLGDAVTAGRIGLDTAGFLRKGLGEPAAGVTPEMLRDALTALIERCTDLRAADRGIAARQGLNAEQAFTAARHSRDQIDTNGIAARADALRAAQYLRTWRKPNGMVHGDFDLNPENGTFLLEVLAQITGPRRGGPRFVDKERKARAQKIIDDPRSTNQIHAETLIELIHIAVNADPGTVFSGSRPTARVVVQRATPGTTTGNGSTTDHGALHDHGAIEGHPDPIPQTDIDRHLCDGFTAIAFDDDQVVDIGREKRLFTERQKLALAVRDGGCLWPGCDKPPSWTEAHHINEWLAKVGLTNIADGILLCRPDHLRLHNEGWTIKREATGTYWLVPPPGKDPDQTPIRLASKAALHLGSPVTLPAIEALPSTETYPAAGHDTTKPERT
ncbi:HNH endonuclease signature motif containing protein, partial [Cryobacterium psychrotolerans]|uniref:HNH endonuclease signature motif containing protein n=1 Tax=Cryobacterium psychrotolerans TaxID=386301 RepID=UPI00107349D7